MTTSRWLPLILFVCLPAPAGALAEWTVLNYIEADNNISRHAWFNIEGMKRVGSSDNVNVLVQLDEPKTKKTWRYKITKGSTTQDASLEQDMGLNPVQELIDAATWAHTAHPSEKLLLVLWNHGNGILDERKSWADYKTKGILYDFTNDTYLNNQDLQKALNHIATNVLKRKIDILGMDACLMAMLEVAYQVQNSAHYLVASQNIEISPGWYHFHYLKRLVYNINPVPADQLAKSIVSSFTLLNKFRNKISTQSVIQLEYINHVTQALDVLVQEMMSHLNNNAETFLPLLKHARKKALQFDDNRYIDIGSFCHHLQHAIKHLATYNKLSTKLKHTMQAVNKAVLLTQSGSKYKNACGMSIYFPVTEIHSSYPLTDFARKTQWLTFLNKYLALTQ